MFFIIFFSRCDNSTGIGLLELPAQELCEITREPCKIVQSVRPWPDFLQCNHSQFVKGCTVNETLCHRILAESKSGKL